MIFGGLVKLFVEFKIFPGIWEKFISFTKQVVTGTTIQGQGGMFLSSPGVSPAYMGVGYIIGPKLASLNFSGGVLAWGLLTPIIFYFVSPFLNIPEWGAFLAQSKNIPLDQAMKSVSDPMFQIQQVWRFIVRPIAIGGMLVGASFTLYKMRKSLIEGIKRSIGDVKKAATGNVTITDRTEKDLPFFWILNRIIIVAVATFLITFFIFQTSFLIALVSATIMIVLAFFFAAVSGYWWESLARATIQFGTHAYCISCYCSFYW